MILHNIKSREFFENHPYSDYSDETIGPDTLDRMVVPHDIDCLILKKDADVLIKHFTRCYFLRVKSVKNVYFNNEVNSNYTHMKLYVLCHLTKIVYVKVDLIVQITGLLMMPYMNLDFDVNGLTLTSNGLALNNYLRENKNKGTSSMENMMKLVNIVDNIRSKKAVVMDKCSKHRYLKLLMYGWNIQFVSKLFHYYFREDYEGECVICKEKITGCSVNYKHCPCDVRICLRCIGAHYNKLSSCPLCTAVCYNPDEAIYDITILKCKYE